MRQVLNPTPYMEWRSIGLQHEAGARMHDTSSVDSAATSILGERLGLSQLVYDPTVDDTMGTSSPTRCVVAALREEFRATRTAAVQRMFVNTTRPDTVRLAPPTVQMAQRCGQQWTGTETNVIQLPGLFRLALIAGQDDRANAIGTHWVQMASSQDSTRGERLLGLVQLIGGIRSRTPERIQLMQDINTKLQKLGPGATEQQLDALDYFRRLSGQLGDFAQQMKLGDTIRGKVYGISSIGYRRLFARVFNGADESLLFNHFRLPFNLADPQFQATFEHELEKGKPDLHALQLPLPFPVSVPTTLQGYLFAPRILNDSVVAGMHLQHSHPIVAQHWYGQPDTTATYPRQGVLTVIVSVGVCATGHNYGANNCLREYAAWTRLYQEFAPQGVEFILVTNTSNSFGLSTLLSAKADVDSLRSYFRDYKKLPGILAIQETQFSTLPDGRKVPQENPVVYQGIVTTDGVVWPWANGVMTWISEPEGFIAAENFLKNQLAQGASKGSSPGNAP